MSPPPEVGYNQPVFPGGTVGIRTVVTLPRAWGTQNCCGQRRSQRTGVSCHVVYSVATMASATSLRPPGWLVQTKVGSKCTVHTSVPRM